MIPENFSAFTSYKHQLMTLSTFNFNLTGHEIALEEQLAALATKLLETSWSFHFYFGYNLSKILKGRQ